MARSPLWLEAELTQHILCKATLMVLTVTTNRRNLIHDWTTGPSHGGSWQVDYHTQTRPSEEVCILTCSSATALSSVPHPHIDTALLLLTLHCALRSDIWQTSRRLCSVLHMLIALNAAESSIAVDLRTTNPRPTARRRRQPIAGVAACSGGQPRSLTCSAVMPHNSGSVGRSGTIYAQGVGL
jgi:hypothetical protein